MSARVKAFLIHLSSSLVVIGLFYALLFTAWYPDYFFELEGVWRVVKIVILVAIVIGPFLTLVVYDLRKGIKVVNRDVAVIVLVQLLALGWGVRAVYLGQPDYLAFSSGQFSTISRNEVVGENSDKQFTTTSWDKPLTVYIRPVTEGKERTEQIWGFLEGRLPDLQYQFDRYQSYEMNKQEIASRGQTVKNAVGTDMIRRSKFDSFLSRHGGTDEDYLLYTVFSHEREGVLVLSRDEVEPVDFIDMIIN